MMNMLPVYLYTAEVYPTPVRGLGLALTATSARFLHIHHQRHHMIYDHHNHLLDNQNWRVCQQVEIQIANQLIWAASTKVTQYWWVCFHFPLKFLQVKITRLFMWYNNTTQNWWLCRPVHRRPWCSRPFLAFPHLWRSSSGLNHHRHHHHH